MEEQLREAHAYLPNAYRKLKEGRISRREFMRMATLLGMSVGAATIAAQCGAPAAAPAPAEPAPAEEEPAAAEEPAAEEPAAEAAPAGGIKRGGTLRVASQVPAVDHPARYSWVFDANQSRLVTEYLTETAPDNVTRPYLLESWEANDDLTMWTLNLHKGIMWSNGDELVADDVLFNFGEWLNPDVGSSILGLWEGFLTIDGVEKVDDHTVNLSLTQPLLAVPENLFHYPAQIVHRNFDGNITSGKNPGTGPYSLVEHKVGERVRIEKREGYWQMGEDDQPLPYLDAIEWIDLGEDQTSWVAAILSGQVHNMYQPSPDTFLALKDSDKVNVQAVGTDQARVFRVRVDIPPWDNQDERNAIKKLQDRQKILDTAFFGEGLLGHDVHVSPVQPEFAPMDVPEYDPDGAKELLAGAGQEGLAFNIAVGTGWTDVVAYAETYQEDAKAAGVDVSLNTMPNSAFWDLWTEAEVAVTPWTHRPLAVMLLPLAYIADSEGKPVPWNESRWVDEEFTARLVEAQGTLDVEARRAIMTDVQAIMQERGPVLIAWWQNQWDISNPAFIGMQAHPTNYNLWQNVWYDPDLDPFA
jgi:peptide/nickel transport system substrate-binding protein